MLGCTLAPFLESKGHSVICHGHKAVADVSCDLTDSAATNTLMQAVGPQCVINLVAATNVDDCERNPHAAYMLNVRTVETIVESLARRDQALLLHVSTDQVYDTVGESSENDIRLTNTYALSKYAGELAAQRMPAVVLRTNFFGPSRLATRKSFSDWLLDNFRQGKPFTAFADVSVSPLSMDTLSAVIERVVNQPEVGVFNVGSHHGMSKADFAEALAHAFDLPLGPMRRGSSEEIKLAAYRPKDMCMNSSKFEQAFDMALPCLVDEINRLRTDENAAA
jgi:dTDP-4-dehydrorhamnose reductase